MQCEGVMCCAFDCFKHQDNSSYLMLLSHWNQLYNFFCHRKKAQAQEAITIKRNNCILSCNIASNIWMMSHNIFALPIWKIYNFGN